MSSIILSLWLPSFYVSFDERGRVLPFPIYPSSFVAVGSGGDVIFPIFYTVAAPIYLYSLIPLYVPGVFLCLHGVPFFLLLPELIGTHLIVLLSFRTRSLKCSAFSLR
jgi:hypothetical protein